MRWGPHPKRETPSAQVADGLTRNPIFPTSETIGLVT